MMKSASPPDPRLDDRASAVLSKAVVRASRLLGLSSKELGRVLGISEPSVSRLVAGKRLVAPTSKEGELAIRLVRLFRSGLGLWGSERNLQAWLRARNSHLNGVPAELVQRIDGLVYVTDYLDAFRARV